MPSILDTNETEELRNRLVEAEATLRAIQCGDVDALVVSGPNGNQIYTLRGEDTAYRVLVEAMNEGALVLTPDGTVTYCNSTFAQMLDVPLEQIIGSRIQRFVVDADAETIGELLRARSPSESRRELSLRHRSTGQNIPTQVSVAALPMDDVTGISAVVTDLSRQKRVESELESYRLHLEDLVRERTLQLDLSEKALRESAVALRLFERAAMSMTDAMIISHPTADNPVQRSMQYVNPAFEAMTRFSAAEAIGRDPRSFYGPTTSGAELDKVDVALRTGQPVRADLTMTRKDGTEYHIELELVPVTDESGEVTHWVDVQRDVTDRKRIEAALIASEEHLRLATEGGRIGTWSWNMAEDCLTCSDSMMAMRGRAGDQPAGFEGFLENVHPEDRDKKRSALNDAVESHCDYDIELRVVWPDGSVRWLAERGRPYYDKSGVCVRMEGAGIDITDRKTTEEELRTRAEREAALNRISEAIRQNSDLQEVQTIALEALANALYADRTVVLLMNGESDLINVVAEWRKEHLAPMKGDRLRPNLNAELNLKFPGMQSLVVPDIESDNITSRYAEMWRSLQIGAILEAPIATGGRVVGAIGVFVTKAPRHWTTDEIRFVEAVASQLRAAMESSRMLADAEDRAEREALINRIGEVMRRSADPSEIRQGAVNMLAEAMAVDRCYVAVYDLDQAVVTIENEFHRSDLASVIGEYRFDNTVEMFCELYDKGTTSVIVDRDHAGLSEQTVANMVALDLRSRLSVAVANVRGTATVTVAMSETAREWTAQDIEIIERVATQLRSAVELARAQQRERRIAHDLQDALLPAIPRSIPGMELSSTMRPALDEAGIGGDFCDVFAIDNNLYALVIGDVSGKGLAAAAQLALIRNSLRMTLYLFDSPADCLARLNRVLTTQDLLIGFVTVFVGIYNARTGEIAYSSAGHEPPLIRRAAGNGVEQIASPAPPLGVIGEAEYVDSYIKLGKGDTVLFYTDGLSEAGPNRQELLDTEGLIQLFASVRRPEDLDLSLGEIIDRAHKYADGVFRDDVCALMVRRLSDAG
jgi:PAS domain S-box-containing protein